MGIESARLSFHGLLSPWAAVILAVAAAVAIFRLYWREHGKFGPARRAGMALLRVAVVGAILFLLLRPVLVTETRGERPRGPALLVDNSLSMTLRDQRLSAGDRLRVAIAHDLAPLDAPVTTDAPVGTPENPTRAALVQAVLTHPKLKLEENLSRIGPLRAYLAGQRLRRVEEVKAESLFARLSAQLKNDETRSALADAVLEILGRDDGDLPAAIVLLTDGQDNASKVTLEEAARECARLKVPLHIYGAGSSDVGNLGLKDFSIPETIFYDDTVSVPVRWRCRGFRQGSAEIVLRVGAQVVARREVALSEGEDFREVLTFTPRKGEGGEERTTAVVELRYKGTEMFTDDNSARRPVEVVDRKVKLLYVEGSPRWEYKFLQPALLRDRRVEARFFLANADRRALGAGPPYLNEFPPQRQDLFAYDILILGDVAPAAIGPDRLAWIRDFVKEGGSLIFMSGRQHAPGSYANSPIAEVLPVEFSPAKFSALSTERPQAYLPVLTRFGERAEMLALADTPEESARVWQTLPGFYWNFPVTRLRPGAVALAVHPRQKAGEHPMPILATQYYGKGQVVFMATDETWRWRYNAQDKYFGRFWGQVIYQLGLPHLLGTPKRVQISLERPENMLGRPSHVYARVFDAEYRPFTGEKVNGRLERLDAKPGEERSSALVLHAVAGQPGEYRALLAHATVGRFAVRIDDPAAAALEYRVGLPAHHELEVAGLAEAELRTAAGVSGGRFYREEDLHRLAANVQPRNAAFTVRHEELLWNTAALVIFVLLITAEWLARKFSNLS